MSDIERTTGIRKLELPEKVKAFLVTLECPDGMRYLFQEPYYFYSRGAPEDPGHWPELAGRALLPLWEHSERVFAADVGASPTEYISFPLENPNEYDSYGVSVMKAIFHMLELHVWEYGGGEQEVLESEILAGRLEFPNLSELGNMLAEPMCSQERIDRYIEQLV
ncbi:hypothetical protein [Pseudomonas abyssi]|uniref:Uncharacterized protein n=1 Tax=Pseudomonas abyssi TaxID=170540 RepID=A0A395QY92_9PSED|nr:hypothetical protein [Halopseudomonas gallaeciensis]RGP52502.1 hypothetical protein ASB58_19245 [Halopseudomonas gallaeciensis]